MTNLPVSLLFTVGEEVDHIGMKATSSLALKPRFLIVGEPTESKLAVGHKGCLRFTIRATGKACHSGYPEQGSSAIEKLIAVVWKIQNYVSLFSTKQCMALRFLKKWPSSERLGETTFNCGEILGGAAANSEDPPLY